MVPLWLRTTLSRIQSELNFATWSKDEYPLFASNMSIGRVALLSSILSVASCFHCIVMIQVSLHFLGVLPFSLHLVGRDRLWMVWQWSAYFTSLSLFHILEFWSTALFNPSQASADSFLVNHSTAYTAAAIISWSEFILRFLCIPNWNFFLPPWISVVGLAVVIAAQVLRSLAMITAGQSFAHTIQTKKKSSHVLVTKGVYRIFRHPSYVGFFYWSIGSQVLLGNPLCTVGFAITVWNFFRRRIAFEEESLHSFFADQYPAYLASTYMGIPFLYSQEYGGEAADPDEIRKDD